MSGHASRMSAIEMEDALRFIARRRQEDAELGLKDPAPHSKVARIGRKRERLTPYGVAAFSRNPEHIERLANGDVNTSVMVHKPFAPSEIRDTYRTNGRIKPRRNRATVASAAPQADTARFTTGHDFTS